MAFVACFVGGFAVFVVMRLLGVTSSSPVSRVVGTSVLLVWGGALAYAVWAEVGHRMYRCRECGGRTESVELPDRAIHKYCAACNIEWDVGLRRSDKDPSEHID